jgi:PKD repeat protein
MPYVIFWDPSSGISTTTRSLIERYFTDVAHDSGLSNNVYGAMRQYWDSHGFANYAQTFSPGTQAFVDTNAFPTKDTTNCVNTSVPSGNPCVTDAQVQTELANFVTAHSLPDDGPDPTNLGANAPEYFVVLPSNVNECADSADCADTVYCAYHTAMPFGSNGLVYAMIPLLGAVFNFGSGSGKGCQFDGNAAVQEPNGDQQGDIAIKYISHEQAESITDPLPPNGWISVQGESGSGGETGDQCNATGAFDPNVNGTNPNAFLPTLGGSATGTLYDQLDNGDPYYIQSEWSNGYTNCVMRPSAGTLSAAFTAPASQPTGISATFTANSPGGYSSLTWNFGDGTTSFDHSGADPASMIHTYAHAGVQTVTLTAVDPLGNIATSSRQITVGSPPNAAFSMSPSHAATGVPVKFMSASSDPDSGIAINSLAFAFGDGVSATGSTATHAFTRPGTYTVTLAATNSLNLQAMVSHTITVTPAKINGVKVKNKTSKGAIIVVTVNAPGKLSGIGKRKGVSGAGTYKLQLTLSKAQQHTLASAGRLTVSLKLKFTPAAGAAVTQKIKVKF